MQNCRNHTALFSSIYKWWTWLMNSRCIYSEGRVCNIKWWEFHDRRLQLPTPNNSKQPDRERTQQAIQYHNKKNNLIQTLSHITSIKKSPINCLQYTVKSTHTNLTKNQTLLFIMSQEKKLKETMKNRPN